MLLIGIVGLILMVVWLSVILGMAIVTIIGTILCALFEWLFKPAPQDKRQVAQSGNKVYAVTPATSTAYTSRPSGGSLQLSPVSPALSSSSGASFLGTSMPHDYMTLPSSSLPRLSSSHPSELPYLKPLDFDFLSPPAGPSLDLMASSSLKSDQHFLDLAPLSPFDSYGSLEQSSFNPRFSHAPDLPRYTVSVPTYLGQPDPLPSYLNGVSSLPATYSISSPAHSSLATQLAFSSPQSSDSSEVPARVISFALGIGATLATGFVLHKLRGSK